MQLKVLYNKINYIECFILKGLKRKKNKKERGKKKTENKMEYKNSNNFNIVRIVLSKIIERIHNI